MNPIPNFLKAVIKDEVISVPFRSLDWDFFISVFQIEHAAKTHECVCLHLGDLSKSEANGIPVRIHSGCLTSEVFKSSRCDCEWQLKDSLKFIHEALKGVLIYVPEHEGRGNGLLQKVKSFQLMDNGLTSAEAFAALGIPQDTRDYTPAIATLYRLGVTRIQLITNNPAKIKAAQSSGLEVVDRIPSVMQTTDPEVLSYLKSKRKQLGHLI